ncbi:MAG TPA: hypothetical protein VFF13_04600 [archaeon]|nr:hypothetical protein [archaeon]
MSKGILFSIDAILAIGLIVTMFSATVLLTNNVSNLGAQQSLLHGSASDEAYNSYLTNDGSTDDVVNSETENATCYQIYDYQPNETIVEKVKKCAQLE